MKLHPILSGGRPSSGRDLLRLAALLWFAGGAAFGQAFNSGSDGSFGAINLTKDTVLPVPPNGIFNCTTITVPNGVTLTFQKNALNTPVYLLATGDVSIVGTVNVSGGGGNNVIGGAGGPGGFDGGSPGSVSSPPGDGYGPGAGRGGAGGSVAASAGSGSFATVSTTSASLNKGATYGNALLIPMIGGSGGGGVEGTPGVGGGGGGGALLIASNSKIDVPGTLRAQGGSQNSGANNNGSGGSIRLVAPKVSGGGSINVQGSGSGDGRIRIDAVDRTQLGLSFFPSATTSIGSLLQVFPNPLPRLDITQAAGTDIPAGSGPVSVNLPFGSSPNRTVVVQASNFNAQVPLTLVLTPDHGQRIVYTGTVDNTANNPATFTFNVVLPINEQTAVNVYSK